MDPDQMARGMGNLRRWRFARAEAGSRKTPLCSVTSRYPDKGLVEVWLSGGDDTHFPKRPNHGPKKKNPPCKTVVAGPGALPRPGRGLLQQLAKGWHEIPERGVMMLVRAAVVS